MKKIIFALLLLWISQVHAQQAVVASGGNATGSDGSSSYSVGQIAYQTYSSSAGTISEGVQQAYEIFTLATSEATLRKNITLYPNPVDDILFVDFNEEAYQNAQFQLFDAQGKLIKQGKFNQKKNEINMSLLPRSIYILRIQQDSQEVKTFKIIKK